MRSALAVAVLVVIGLAASASPAYGGRGSAGPWPRRDAAAPPHRGCPRGQPPDLAAALERLDPGPALLRLGALRL
jgi:hypothetical protein